jgi:8-oxo-dGTP diphosphatase
VEARLGPHLGRHRYVDNRGRPKTADYWLMEAVGGRFTPGDEVDELRWLDAAEAGRLLSYERDRELLATAAAAVGPAGGPVTPASGGS